ncbi:MAG: c-type cytochrome [Rhodospirillaceae bacterium]
MRNSTKMLLAAASLGFILSSGAMPGTAAADTPSSVILANTCFSCHGTDGHSAGAMPSLNGKPAKLIEIALKAFRDGKKDSTVMMRIAKGFDDAEIKALSEYFAKNPN